MKAPKLALLLGDIERRTPYFFSILLVLSCGGPDVPAGSNLGGTTEYTAIDLGVLPGERVEIAALDLSDPVDGRRVIAGSAAQDIKVVPGDPFSETDDSAPVWWEVSDEGEVDGPHLLPGKRAWIEEGLAQGVSEDGEIMVGSLGRPVRWDRRDTTWVLTELGAVEGYRGGLAWDVNNDGIAVGWSTDVDRRPVRVATVWNGFSAPVSLPNPLAQDGGSGARAISPSGIVAGVVYESATPVFGPETPASSQGIVWLPEGGWCLVGQGGVHGISEVSEGVILLASAGGLGRVREVDIESCTVRREWLLEPSAFGWNESGSQARDVRKTTDGWVAVGGSGSPPVMGGSGVSPAIWRFDGQEVAGRRLSDDPNLKLSGRASAINRTGEVLAGSLWIPADRPETRGPGGG